MRTLTFYAFLMKRFTDLKLCVRLAYLCWLSVDVEATEQWVSLPAFGHACACVSAHMKMSTFKWVIKWSALASWLECGCHSLLVLVAITSARRFVDVLLLCEGSPLCTLRLRQGEVSAVAKQCCILLSCEIPSHQRSSPPPLLAHSMSFFKVTTVTGHPQKSVSFPATCMTLSELSLENILIWLHLYDAWAPMNMY